MTKGQRISLHAEWWPNACRAQGWNPNDRAFKLQKLSEIVGRPLSSSSDLDNRDDIDKVKTHLLSLADNLKATMETIDPTEGEARRLRHVIRSELVPCLALYVEAGQPGAEAYLQTVITGLARWNTTDRPTRPPTLDDLDARPIASRSGPCHSLRQSPSQLHQVVMTLSARLNAKRKEAGDTIHGMRTRAGLPCTCKQCMRPRVVVVAPKPEEAECPF